MKIIISSERFRFAQHLPIWFIKTRYTAKKILENSNDKEIDSSEIAKLQKQIKSIYKFLKKFVRENGHFTLIDVEEKSGDKVLIKI